MFRNRDDAGRQLAEALKGRPLHDPVVLAIPRGGVVTGAALARALNADLDVVLARKLRAPGQPELAIGAISEQGAIYLQPVAEQLFDPASSYLAEESRQQFAEIARRQELFRSVRPAAPLTGRSVIVTDDGIATGSTMIAALHTARAQHPHELIVAVPVCSPDRIDEIRRWCDDLICLIYPENFWAVGQFYLNFAQVEDAEVVELLRAFAPAADRVA